MDHCCTGLVQQELHLQYITVRAEEVEQEITVHLLVVQSIHHHHRPRDSAWGRELHSAHGHGGDMRTSLRRGRIVDEGR